MHCVHCGAVIEAGKRRCSSCHHHSSTLRVVNLSFLMIAMAAVTTGVYLKYIAPVSANVHVYLGTVPSGWGFPAMRIGHLLFEYGPWALLLVTLYWAVYVLSELRLPGFLQSATTWSLLAIFVVGLCSFVVIFRSVDTAIVLGDVTSAAMDLNREKQHNRAAHAMDVLYHAELAYRAQHPQQGFSCNYADLAPLAPKADQTLLVQSSLYYDYKLAGCSGAPATKYQLSAMPRNYSSARLGFCADEAGVVYANMVSEKNSACWKDKRPYEAP